MQLSYEISLCNPFRWNNLSAAIRALFAAGEQGAWYDPSDFTTLFQDSAGATPVTAVEQQVGKMNDKSGRGNHALQATAPARPTLSARVNLLTKTEDLTNAVWTKLFAGTGSTPVVTSGFTDPNGGTTAFRVQATIGAGTTAGDYSILRQAVAGSSVAAAWIKSNTGSTQNIVAFNYNSGAVRAITTTWQQYAGPRELTIFDIGLRGDTAADKTIDFLIWHPQVVSDSVVGPYQSVNTASDYDTAGFPYYEKLDGIDDSMSSATGGGGTAGFFLCQAIKPTGGAGALRTIWSDTGTNSGYKVQLDAANKLSFSAGNGTAFTTIASTATVDVGTTSLITVWDDGTNLNVQIGSAAAQTVARPVVTAGTATFTLGKDNGAATSYFTGNLYTEVYRQGSGLTAAQRTSVQTYCKSKAGL